MTLRNNITKNYLSVLVCFNNPFFLVIHFRTDVISGFLRGAKLTVFHPNNDLYFHN